jgi:hypothetical protein
MVPKASGTCVQEMYECIYLVSVEERERKSKQFKSKFAVCLSVMLSISGRLVRVKTFSWGDGMRII